VLLKLLRNKNKREQQAQEQHDTRSHVALILIREMLLRIVHMYDYNPLSLSEMIIASLTGVGFGVFLGFIIAKMLGW
jgi:hypothetical protein